MSYSIKNKIRLPAEWEKQSGVLLVWPHVESDWKHNLDEINKVYLDMCRVISKFQKILLIFYDQQHKNEILKLFKKDRFDEKKYQIIIYKTNDTWCRDYAPITIYNGNKIQLQNFTFNAWGNKYPAKLDNNFSKHLHQNNIFAHEQINYCDFILEGGCIDSDGQGSLLTSNCLLKRHPNKNKQEIESILTKYLGVNNILWLEHGSLTGDDTDGHIDNLARFIDKDTIVYSACDDKNHPDYISLKRMEAELHDLKQTNGKKYKLIPMHIPNNIIHKNKHLPASYVNFMFINDALLVPSYQDPQDSIILENLCGLFSNRHIISINSMPLIKQFGSLHCASMHFPKGLCI